MDVREDDRIVPPPADETVTLPEEPATDPYVDPAEPGSAGRRSLFDDFEALIDDARIYAEAEWSYQKTRAGFVTNRVKTAVVFGAVAAFFGILAAIGLTVGLIIALTPLITAWGATAFVVLAWLLAAWLLLRKASGAWQEISAAMDEEPIDE